VQVTIAGGGPGGLFASLVLAGDGHDVVVLEQTAAPCDDGAGIQISPNGMRLLAHAGLLDEIRAVAFEPRAAELRCSVSGRQVFRAPLGSSAEARYGAPYFHLHRADLTAVLADAARHRGVDLRYGARVSSCTTDGSAPVHTVLDDGTRIESDLLIGADGIHSVIRSELFGSSQARFTGQAAWRGLVPANKIPPGLIAPDATVWAGPGRHFVHYFVRAGALINFVAVEERAAWAEENWQIPGDIDDLRRSFRDWDPGITALLDAAEKCHLWGLHDRPPLDKWTRGRVALLGDACHPMLPFMAQGAVMAFEAAVVLARALRALADDIPAALASYEAVRKPRTTRVQERARRNGKLFHRRSALGRSLAFTPMTIASRFAPSVIARQLDWLYGYDASTAGISRIS